MTAVPDCVVIGGGVVGLSIAYELATHGQRVTVVDRQAIGREASWAGAGILPPARRSTALHPYDQLRGLSLELHEAWAQRLQAETGVDTGYRRCGGIYIAQTAGEAAALHGLAALWAEEQIEFSKLDTAALLELEPGLAQAIARRKVRVGYWAPAECQLRNPRHLQALATACQRRGVRLVPDTEVHGWVRAGGRVVAVATRQGEIPAARFCVAAGAWSQRLLEGLGVPTGVFPVRGQMLLWKTDRPLLRRVLNIGSRYLVPRDDGHLLVGSTEEEVGFDKRTTEVALAELTELACELVPELRSAERIQAWAGLRPASLDGWPYLGAAPLDANVFAAAGHFRSGLYLSPATAVVLGQLMRGERPEIDVTPFRLGRG